MALCLPRSHPEFRLPVSRLGRVSAPRSALPCSRGSGAVRFPNTFFPRAELCRLYTTPGLQAVAAGPTHKTLSSAHLLLGEGMAPPYSSVYQPPETQARGRENYMGSLGWKSQSRQQYHHTIVLWTSSTEVIIEPNSVLTSVWLILVTVCLQWRIDKSKSICFLKHIISLTSQPERSLISRCMLSHS